jgi:hypothetical protein
MDTNTPSYLKQLYNKLYQHSSTQAPYNARLPNNVQSWLDYSNASSSDYSTVQNTFNSLPVDNRLNIYNDYMMYDNGYMYEGYIGDGMSVDDYQRNIISDPEMYDLYVQYYLNHAK